MLYKRLSGASRPRVTADVVVSFVNFELWCSLCDSLCHSKYTSPGFILFTLDDC